MILPRAILWSVCLLIYTYTFAQEGLKQEEVMRLSKLQKGIRGTYQIQMLGTRKQPVIPLELIQQIENNRKENEVSYINYCSDYRIMVLPRNIISSESFIPVKPIAIISLDEMD